VILLTLGLPPKWRHFVTARLATLFQRILNAEGTPLLIRHLSYVAYCLFLGRIMLIDFLCKEEPVAFSVARREAVQRHLEKLTGSTLWKTVGRFDGRSVHLRTILVLQNH